MTSLVKLYVYDLSGGVARQMSAQLTGRQIDGIWHTSVVVFGKEIFYGRGVNTTQPGKSHYGSPVEMLDMGETAIDEETFKDYLEEIKEHYTAEKYHLLEFNCNSFTNDCIGFLTGGSIPDHIKELPTDFLATPFGQALRPTIDAMYSRPTPGQQPPVPPTDPGLLQAITTQTQQPTFPPPRAPSQATESLTSPVRLITNPPAFQHLLKTNRTVVAFFTDKGCPPCRMIEPVFESLAAEKGIQNNPDGVAFAKIFLAIGLSRQVASEYSVRVTPTFIFFLDGKKVDELKGANQHELRTQIDLLIFSAHPPHPHKSLSLPTLQAVSLAPILFTTYPPLDTVNTKLASFIDATASSPAKEKTNSELKQTIEKDMVPFLKSRFAPPPSGAPANKLPQLFASPQMLQKWAQATTTLVSILPLESIFPLIDMWRLALLDSDIGTWAAATHVSPLTLFLGKVEESSTPVPRNTVLTLLRMLSNAFGNPTLAQSLISSSETTVVLRNQLTSVLISSLLHEEVNVRSAAAGVAFNIAAVIQRNRNAFGNDKKEEDESWEVELVSAVVEAINREAASEDVVHRLTASLGFLLYLSPFYETELKPLLEALESKQALEGKLVKGGCGEAGVQKTEIKKLVEEVARLLCP